MLVVDTDGPAGTIVAGHIYSGVAGLNGGVVVNLVVKAPTIRPVSTAWIGT